MLRHAGRLLAVVTIAALLAPGARWAFVPAGAADCACPRQFCHCPGHHDADGHAAMCHMTHGSPCGVDSHDSVLTSLVNTLTYLPTEHAFGSDLVPRGFNHDATRADLAPSHSRRLDPPPRPTL